MSSISALPLWQIILIGYLVTGGIVMNLPRARREILSLVAPDVIKDQPRWKVYSLFSIALLVSLALWPLFVPDWFSKRRSLMDELEGNEAFQAMRAVNEAMAEMSRDGCETDEIPGSYGEFGHDISNPVPTRAVSGSISYLGRLNAPDGTKVQYTRIGSYTSPVSASPVDGYEISHADGTTIGMIYVSPYHKRNSEKAPSGLDLISSKDEASALFERWGAMGQRK